MLELMEIKLLRIIMNPSMIASYFFGIWLILLMPEILHQGWFHIKFTCVLLLTFYHMLLAKYRKQFLMQENLPSETYFRILNEIPVILLVVIVINVVVKPF